MQNRELKYRRNSNGSNSSSNSTTNLDVRSKVTLIYAKHNQCNKKVLPSYVLFADKISAFRSFLIFAGYACHVK